MKSQLKTLIEYNTWATQQVWNCVSALSEEQFKQAHDYSTGSVYEQVFHIMSTDFFTLKILDGSLATTYSSDYPKKEDFTTREAIWEKWRDIDKGYYSWFESVSVDDLTAEIGFSETEDLFVAGSWAEWLMVYANHSTNHRAQVLALIHKLGGETCEMGLYYFMRERSMTKTVKTG